MSLPTTDYPRLKAPREDGSTLLWPAGEELAATTHANSQQLRHDGRVTIAGLPLGRVRAWQRRWLGHGSNEQLLIATGHQAELYHPGVWAKNCVIDTLARRLGGAAIHFSVDTDAPKHLDFRAPGQSLPLTDDPRQKEARWSGLLEAPSTAHVTRLGELAHSLEATWGFAPVAAGFVETLSRLSGQAVELPCALANAHHQVDRELAMGHSSLVASPMWASTGYLVFAYDLLHRADSLAAAYNAALADFRVRHGIHSPGRPIPDLPVDLETCETPFWLDFLEEGARKRAIVSRCGDTWALQASGDVFEFSPPRDGWAAGEALQRWLKSHKLRLAPRALALTLFLRLCVVDQFVHGIGGGLYDQVTDSLMRSWYGIEPPAFSVATATLLFPAAVGREQVCLHCLRQEGRRLRHASLGERKQAIVTQIKQSPRHSRQRQALFVQMQRELASAVAASDAVNRWQAKYDDAEKRHDVEQAIFDREIPYIMQPANRLERLIGEFDRMIP